MIYSHKESNKAMCTKNMLSSVKMSPIGDPEISYAINKELLRQNEYVELIASENFVSKDVLIAQGSILTNKYAEGYPGKRYYGGCEYIDYAENLAKQRLKKLFNANFVNVQPHSGSQANQAVMLALLKPGDKVLGMSLSSGGHLTHGSKVNLSGKWFDSVSYGVSKETFMIDYDEVLTIAKKERPKIIICGASAYPRTIDFKKFREIADEVKAYLFADVAHIAGLIVTGYHPSPIPYADVITSTTHKTLRGPRGGVILCNDEKIAKKIDSAVFPGLQGGPLMHIIAAKAVCFKEALDHSFKYYIENVIKNSKKMAEILSNRGFNVITGGTDNHLSIINTHIKGITGRDSENYLEQANITCNKNAIPFDNLSPTITSGIRIGSAACTTRGFDDEDFELVANSIADVLENYDNVEIIEKTKIKMKDLCSKYPIYFQ